MSQILSFILLSSILWAAPVAKSQPASDNQTFLLTKVSSSGSKRFREEDIIRATGLKTGSTVTAGDIKKAASRLGDSGVFAQVSYRYDGRSADYTVVDAEPFVPVSFENFIWFSDAELIERIRKTVPLFAGSLPLAGNLGDQVSAALDAILKEKSIPGHVVLSPVAKLGGPVQSMQYQIEGLNVKVSEFRFPGAASDHIPLLQKVMANALAENYLQSFYNDVVRQNAPPVYGKLGFLKAQLGKPKPVILKDDPVQPLVAVEVPVQEGDPYTFAGANWSGANAIPIAELTKLVDLKPGAAADTTRLGADIASAKELYGTKGYMFVQIKSTATLENEKHTAIFNLDVQEGPLYRMGKLEVQAPDAARGELVKRVWEMHEGDVYDASYVKNFLTKHPRELASLNGWNVRFVQTIHDDTHVVDLSLKFEKFQPQAK
jgi:outer membrane protein insertion porin family